MQNCSPIERRGSRTVTPAPGLAGPGGGLAAVCAALLAACAGAKVVLVPDRP